MVLRFQAFSLFSAFVHERAPFIAMDPAVTPLGDIETVDVPGKPSAWIADRKSLRRRDRRFMRGIGVRVGNPSGTPVSGWRQFMIAGDHGGRIVLITAVIDGEYHLLVRLRGEPGNIGIQVDGVDTCVLVTPPLQFSRSNLEHHRRALRGDIDDGGKPVKRIPLADLVRRRDIEWWYRQPVDGGRFWRKWNNYGILHLGNDLSKIGAIEAALTATGPGAADFAWISFEVLRQALRARLINSDLRAVLAFRT